MVSVQQALMIGGENGGSLTRGLDRQLRGLAVSLFVGQRLGGFLNKESGSALERLAELIETGEVTPSLDRTYPLHRAPEAMRHLEARTGAGCNGEPGRGS